MKSRKGQNPMAYGHESVLPNKEIKRTKAQKMCVIEQFNPAEAICRANGDNVI